ncbi:MAG: DUF5615 family PIN-like protein [Cytophagaceae bacterium]|nr:DUF5615 family PIN-like protein [Cytophagaceae bacterium]
MTLLLDAQLTPGLARWVTGRFGYTCYSLRHMDLHTAEDSEIFFKAREMNAVVITKDSDFLKLLDRFGPPPKIIWLTCGNTSNQRMREIFEKHLVQATAFLETSNLVEITGVFLRTT